MSDVSVVVADLTRLQAIRDGLRPPGRVMHFTSGTLAGAMESIRAYQPRLIAIDALFAQTPSGAAFVDRIEAMPGGGRAIQLIVQRDGRWVTVQRDGVMSVTAPEPPIGAPSQPAIVAPSQEPVASLSNPIAAAAQVAALNTRRAPRFLVRDPVDAVVESGRAAIVDLSVLGAQIVSQPTLRPNQKIKVELPDTDDVLNLVAQVAWSTFEQSKSGAELHYRAGIEFAGAAQQTLEDYCRRHCGEQPIPVRGR
jgi:hypothetical protein